MHLTLPEVSSVQISAIASISYRSTLQLQDVLLKLALLVLAVPNTVNQVLSAACLARLHTFYMCQ